MYLQELLPKKECQLRTNKLYYDKNVCSGKHFTLAQNILHKPCSSGLQHLVSLNTGQKLNSFGEILYKHAHVADTALQKSLRQFCKYCWPNLNYEKYTFLQVIHFQC